MSSTFPTTHRTTFRTTYGVSGMTCGHCVAAVSSELGALDGVTAVQIDLGTGEVTVTHDRDLARPDVAAAVHEAGYDLRD